MEHKKNKLLGKKFFDTVEELQRFINAIKALEQHPTTDNNLGVDAVLRADARKAIIDHQYSDSFCEEHNIDHSINTGMALIALSDLPSVTPQELNIEHCKDCKRWKDSDGEYRRGVNAESQCPINRKEVYEGNGYCFLYEPQESEE